MNKRYQFFKKLTVYITFFIVSVFALIKSKHFIVPILLAILIAYLLYPIAAFLESRKIPRIISILLSIIVAIAVIVATISFFSNQLAGLTENLSQLREQATININRIGGKISSTTGIHTDRLESWISNLTTNVLESSGDILQIAFTTTTNTIVRTLLMPVFVFLLLFYRNKAHDFLVAMAENSQKKKAEEILHEINSVSIKYMTGVLIVVIILSIVHSVAFSIIGLEFAILLGVIAALFNFIPYFGTLIGAVIPIIYTFLSAESLSKLLWLMIYFVIIQFVENNILTPNITGGKVRLNPLVTILSLIFGSMVWGVPGMFIIVPYMAMVRVFCEHVNYLEPVGFLLSERGTERHSISWDNIKHLFKKK
jgi:predicted PurR-regulated permease PerM